MSFEKKREIKVNFPESMQGGVYTNNTIITHTKEEFIMDFLMVAPPSGAVTARVITSPGHMKRILAALQENISKYEQKFGEIKASAAPMETIGFVPPTKH
ncbi:DUF3467 domain-containing protein [Candidatus Oleimmundimicrobium sp.]|uniref:DUF3467 domain-containing protein n=1 Tax=Candidatus Oleimmundimicrobium sp. TaxID=3060597 RepID=UPI0027291E35|nr:DUF3467 domain-containing protein [Candidatus Oleimmundimicrobium sp.]MDO8886014.1 DUF3467 domain-containing protein [Candidatus Oleimmundimicrobium sp.]